MTPLLLYLLKMVACSDVLYVYYWMFLRKQTNGNKVAAYAERKVAFVVSRVDQKE